MKAQRLCGILHTISREFPGRPVQGSFEACTPAYAESSIIDDKNRVQVSKA